MKSITIYNEINLYQNWLGWLKKESSGFKDCDQKNIEIWFEWHVDDAGYQEMANHEIVNVFGYNPCDDEEDTGNNACTEKAPYSKKMFHCFEGLRRGENNTNVMFNCSLQTCAKFCEK